MAWKLPNGWCCLLREGDRASSNQGIDIITVPIATPITPDALRNKSFFHPGLDYIVTNTKTTCDFSERNHWVWMKENRHEGKKVILDNFTQFPWWMQGLIGRFAVARIRSAGSFLKAEGEGAGGGQRAASYYRNTLKDPGLSYLHIKNPEKKQYRSPTHCDY